MVLNLFRKRGWADQAHALYRDVVAQARQPGFYARLGVPDTLDGRFDMLSLHAFLLMHRLKGVEQAKDLAQAVFDLMFADMDQSLREMGVGDLSVGKKVKQMAQAYLGRVAAYDQALGEGGEGEADGALAQALRRNIYRQGEPQESYVTGIEAYVRREIAHLSTVPDGTFLAGRIPFSGPPAP
ncbi:ubiquinol-cytochrome C chaperone family protein [Zavarzinia sp. CC-PAN008]|uniref:ubiquinol-cytochrome C chaperone family protein n=1 Tax=Zavarzinia sp. CC-PAN008 TaxID=3243332 RepID=UPI003F744FAA